MIITEEVWKDIKNYEGYYQISNLGRVRSLDRYIKQTTKDGRIYKRFINGKIMSCKRDNGAGYKNILLHKGFGSNPESFYLHILVAEHFIENNENKPQVNHKDGDKSNNCINNLEWFTESENTQHAVKTGLYKNSRQLTDKEIIEIYETILNTGMVFEEIAQLYNVKRLTIQNIKNKKNIRYKQLLVNYPDIPNRILRTRFTGDDIRQIFILSKSQKYNDAEIANKFQCGVSTVQHIRQGETWKNITINL